MKTMAACPDTEELRKLLDGSLSAERQQDCTAHMDSCGGCQAKLENMATEGTNLSRVVERVHDAEPATQSAYWPAVNALNPALQQTLVPTPAPAAPRTKGISLNFLQPASDPAYIGRIAQFDVMRVLGRGGMGVVLEAFDSRLQRHVALKFLDPELAEDETSRQRFCREARTAASITHENVVAVYQVEKSADEGLPYLVMQLIAGESLEQRLLREKKLPFREIVRIGMQAAHGLAAAHDLGLIHRDIKPGNILLETSQDRVKLTDFGLARAAEDVKLTGTGFVSGTPLYMAPEQALGEQADPRSDLFSLGAVLYEMCAGEPPFAGNSALAILKQITDSKPRPLSELNSTVPDWLAHTIDRLLAKKPAERIQTAAHLAELFDFQWALMKTASDNVPTVCAIEERKRTIRNRWVAGGVGATFLALGLFGGRYLSHRDSSIPAPPTSAGSPAVSDAKPAAVLSANSGAVWSVAFDNTSDTVAMAVEDGTIRLWDLPTASVKSQINAHRGHIWSMRYSQNCEVLATAGDDRLIKLWGRSTSEPLKTFEHSDAVRGGLALLHDGQTLIAGGRDGGLRVWSLDSPEPLAAVQQPGTVNTLAVSPDDETLATAGSDKIIRLWNARTLTQKLPLEGHTGPVFGLSFNRDGHRLASAGWDKTVRIWDVASGLVLKSWVGHEGDIWSIAYSPDGRRLATGGTDGALKLWDADAGDLVATYLGHKTGIHTLAFNSDGKLLASGGRDGAVRIWKIESPD
jgi:serine/threonine protein kinase